MKYIDTEKLIHDLEERIFAYSEKCANGDDYRKDAIETLLKDVKYQCSIQQEQPEVDLEEEFANFLEKENAYINDNDVISYYNGGSFNHTYDIYPIARYFFELGLKARKGE